MDWAVFGIDFHAGQVCHAGTRIYVHEDIYDAFLDAFTAKMSKLNVGASFNAQSSQGPLINKSQYDKVLGYIDAGKKEGATLHLGGQAAGTEGYFIKPTIFTNVKPDMTVR